METTAPKPAASPVLTAPIPVAIDPPRHPDAWQVIVEGPGMVAAARPNAISARVRLRLHLRDDGSVALVTIVTSSGRSDLDAAATGAARAWRFLPARRDGVPIESRVLIWVAYVLEP
jgi:protein TonB